MTMTIADRNANSSYDIVIVGGGMVGIIEKLTENLIEKLVEMPA
jgi:hypothetical protein